MCSHFNKETRKMCQLTSEEKRFLILTAFGLNKEQIAAELNMTARVTVLLKRRVKAKLNCQDIFEAIFVAVANGAIPAIMDREAINYKYNQQPL